MKKQSIVELLSNNTYPGRGILIGQSADGAFAVATYFIMGRSENSRNRVFRESGGTVTIYPYDMTKVEDRKYEPDAPNYTPRISGIIDFIDTGFTYKLSILKRAPDAPLSCGNDGACQRFTYAYEPTPGTGHLIHTFKCDGNPLPSFSGEPKTADINSGIDDFTSLLWDSLNDDNKVSLYVSYTDIKTGEQTIRIKNKNE